MANHISNSIQIKNGNAYQIRKTSVEENFSVVLNDGMGCVLEFNTFDDASQLCVILNSNSDSNCRYELIVVNGITQSI